MKPLKIHYPWTKVPLRAGFFVPTFDLERVKADGLRAALTLRIRAKAFYGIRDGRWGVLFIHTGEYGTAQKPRVKGKSSP